MLLIKLQPEKNSNTLFKVKKKKATFVVESWQLIYLNFHL